MFKKLLLPALVMLVVAAGSGKKPVEKTAGGIDLVHIPPGIFTMGRDDKGKDYNPPVSVNFSRGFWLGKYEITQKQYQYITGETPCEGSRYGEGGSLPVYNISWYDAVDFCNKLSERNGLKPYYIIRGIDSDSDNKSPNDEIRRKVKVDENADGFRLPTEAQWEYACRAGAVTDFSWGKDSSWDGSGRYAWHMFNSGQKMYSKGRFWWVKYHKVRKIGTRIPNRFGIYDMCGNVAEWCYDRYSPGYKTSDGNNDPVIDDGEYKYRVVRGGSILDSPRDMTSFKRWPVEPFEKSGTNGIRVVLPE